MEKVTMGGMPLTLVGNEVKVGDTAPDFTVLNTLMQPIKLSDFKNKKAIVITSFPSVDTGICAMQTNKFNAEIGAFGEDVALIIVSNDLPFALGRYCGAHDINNAIVTSDHRDLDFSMNYGLLMKEVRLIARAVMVLDNDRKVVYKQIAQEVKSELDYDKAMNALKQIL